MIDSHAHVQDPAFDEDREAMLERARKVGIDTIVTIGTDIDDSRRALEISKHPGIVASIGVHPHEAEDAPEDLAAALDELLAHHGRAVAIGECGLDYYYDHSPRERQRDVFVAQLRYARERGLPLIFHQRDAYDDFIAILATEFDGSMRGVVHCFTGSAEQAGTLVGRFGLRLGIGGVLTFKTAENVREAVRHVGLEPIILETDCPYLAPVPHRGKRNEPAFMVESAKKVAEILAIPYDDVVASATNATRELFALAGGAPETEPGA